MRVLSWTGDFPPLRLDVIPQSYRFFKMLGSDEMRAWYGPEHVCLAADRGAVGTLLISDGLFRYGSNISAKVVKIKNFL